ncbi:UBC-like protein [Fomitiporia mediterranea MF3/22]|uniref:UBC-like protein n=1 Tax=Fomitiporia mediterranea (strain MF3/22) TaxID=694068 RepID=UPI0004408210|nr:UBC-like protein [Fomitiporia mediterranea MF3/22]EJD07375.1 UBC-like protein [Fomitiporia mediterranea MF3/22]
MASKAAFKRLTKEYVAMQREPPPFVWAAPDEKNILHWNYIIRGPPDSPYAGGEFYGVVLFPSEYPFKPPGIKMLTPSGRFQPDKKICFSMSDFHPGSWNPAWSVATILTGLLSFMLADEMTTGSITTSDSDKRAYAARSHAWNIQNKKFREAFPDYSGPLMKDLPNMAQKELGAQKSAPVLSPVSSTTSVSSAASSPITPLSANSSGPMIPNGTAQAGTASSQAIVPKAKESTQKGRGAFNWGQLMWQKWYWGIFFAVAWAVSSRLTGSP